MTREEIIQGLQFTIDMFLLDPTTGETYTGPRNDMDKTTIDACKGAIELLKQEPCEDAVSRQSVLDELGTCFDTHSIYDENNGENYIIYEDAVDMIEKLPPVTPTTCIAKVTFSKEDLQKLVDEKVAEIKESMCKTGKWIIDDEEHGRIWHCHCSNCKRDPQYYIGGTENWWLVRLPDCCPHCGVKMNKE